MFHFPWFPSFQTPAFAINYYSHGALFLSLVQCFNLILEGKLGAEAHICIGISSCCFSSLVAQQKAYLRVIDILVPF